MPIQNASRFGEQDALRAARHQPPVQPGFEALGKMMADRGLRHVQLTAARDRPPAWTIPTRRRWRRSIGDFEFHDSRSALEVGSTFHSWREPTSVYTSSEYRQSRTGSGRQAHETILRFARKLSVPRNQPLAQKSGPEQSH